MKYITFYTHQYEPEAQKCVSSFAKFGITVKAINYKATKDWTANCLQRTELLQQEWEKNPEEDICRLDSDILCLREPVLFKNIFVDVAVLHRPEWNESLEYNIGVLVLRSTPKAKQFLSKWLELCLLNKMKQKYLPDQIYFKQAMDTVKPKLLALPREYNCKPEQRNNDTVILHNMASRTKKI